MFFVVFFFLQSEINYPEYKINAYGGKVCTFGSYRLGVHTKGKKNGTFNAYLV